MEVFNNTSKIVRDDLVGSIKLNSKISIAAACFSIYAYQELKKQLESVDEFRFIFTSPTFITEKTTKEKREFYIPRLNRERSLYGTEFEVRLRNELTQKAIARECAEWIRKKAKFRSNSTQEAMGGFMNLQTAEREATYIPFNGFTTVDIGCDRGSNVYNMVNKLEAPFSTEYIRLFDSVWNDSSRMQDVTNEVIESISTVYQENPAELVYYMTLSNIFKEFLDDISEDVLPNEATGYKNSIIWDKLYNFQRQAADQIISKLKQYNGCILADSVGLGKTYTALAVIKYFECRNKNVLVLCPKKLQDNWMTYRGNLINNPLAGDRFSYDVLFHTDLSREHGMSSIGLRLEYIDWGNYDLVVIDESHNFRNGGQTVGEYGEKENRYLTLMNKVIRQGVKTKVLMLSATPVNNRFYDLRNQLALAYEGHSAEINEKLNTKSDIDTIFRNAQKVFNSWSKLPPKERTTKNLQDRLDFDFFEVLDSVTIARSRNHIQKYFDTTDIGTFPKRRSPLSLQPKLTDLKNAINYSEIYEQLNSLMLTIYTPSFYILASKQSKYFDPDSKHGRNLTLKGREEGIRRLMSINLLKRLESSVHSFTLTVQRIYDYINETVTMIDAFQDGSQFNTECEMTEIDICDLDLDDQNTEIFNVGKKFKIDLRDMNYLTWQRELQSDLENLELLLSMVGDITPEYDSKLNELMTCIEQKVKSPINPGNRKMLIFTAFSDTAEYLYEHISVFAKDKFGINTALITGTIDGRTTVQKLPADMNTILTVFSPKSKGKELIMLNNHDEVDILIATDCISEGQNLQDCDYCINYDIHWNPVRIIQRFGRIDRIGSRNAEIQLVNFWPDIALDDYINLKARVETRMKISVFTSTGDDDYINQDETGDLQYRRQQLEKLKKEVVDLEEMSSGISILDLGLNDFRMDLLLYIKENPSIDKTPFGIHAVVRGENPGVIFVLKNVSSNIKIESQNRLHPFYMVYIGDDGEVICNNLQPKETLDIMRFLSYGKNAPDAEACAEFNAETNDGRNMSRISALLQETVSSIINVKENSDIDSFFGKGQTSFLNAGVSGLEDFELICFMVVLPK